MLRSLGRLQQRGMFSLDHAPPFSNGGLNVGEQAPAFSATDLEGRLVEFDRLLGRKCVLAFVSPQCSACVYTLDALNEVAQRERDLNVVVVGGTDLEENRRYATAHKAVMPILTPATDTVRELYRIKGVPYVFALDSAGVVRAAGIVNEAKHLTGLLAAAYSPVAIAHEIA
ncbi:MAG TPA: TlpA disulfide reductase family protein [Ktedonobacterales bacterium]|nr:TlpA disulfide reductase family protein [Ktedonobacterales bacterium]